MNKFIAKTVGISIAFSAIIGGVLTFENAMIREKSTFSVPAECKSIIVGHSIPEAAYNDSLIPGFKNIASSGESYFYSLPKLQEVLGENPHVENVFIEFTNNQLNENINEWIWSDKYMTYRYPIYSPFLSWSSKLLLIQKNPNAFLKSLSFALKHNLSVIKNQDYNYMPKTGGYKYISHSIADSLLQKAESFKGDETADSTYSTYSLAYLHKLVEICKDYKKTVYFIRSPQHPLSGCRYNEVLYKRILKEDFKDVKFLDFIDFQLNDDDFADLEHLNYKGARAFSKWFYNVVQQEKQ